MGQEEAVPARMLAGGMTWGPTSVGDSLGGDSSFSNPCSWLCERKLLDSEEARVHGSECVLD